ncbi:uncharacterized protein EV154DRAFT_522996 [Mucor mucedo]|uniref:uncharacterized protein n=1 Tax=Mucor mucedo TaxID=29922 RepID=UPI00222086EB|nr:uncharacterized protein EV154DRAFT_522996 [Mucor mucedo]KAI7882300.1 hypothetical protein EV154DRAFT_522996 [Mucor mucedo]
MTEITNNKKKAPEYVIDSSICQANDMFSLGCLAYAVHNKGVSLLKTFNSFHTYEKQIKFIHSQSFTNIPDHLDEVIRALLVRHPNQRMTPIEFQNSKYFDNLLVSTMKFLESFPEKTREEKAQFMKGLARVLGQFPERVLKRKILPSLLEELKDAQLLPYTIPNIFIIAQKLNQHEFCDLVLPALKPVFSVRDPPQNMIVLLEKLDVLQQKTPRETFRDDVMPLVYAALETPTAMVQEKALRIIPSLAESLDYTAVKSSLFPRVQAVFVQTTVLSVKVSTLICFHSMIKVLDKFTVQEKLVPLLKNIKTKEPAVMLATLAVYDEVGKIADKEIIATEILPQLWRMSFGPLLNLEQFQKFMKTIHDLTKRVEDAHIRHLKEVKSLEEQTRNVSSTSSPQPVNAPSTNDTNVSFESLVGSKTPQVKNGDDMFGSFSSNQATPQPWSSSSTNQAIKPTPSSSNGWVAPQTTTPTNNWNTPKPVTPQQQPSSNWNTTMSPNINTQKPMNATNTWNSPLQTKQTTGWSPSVQSQQIPSLSTPPSFQSNLYNQNSSMNGSNFNALRSIPVTPQKQPTMMPLSSGMGLLQPIQSSPNSNINNNISQVKKMANLHAFDPLG